MSENSRRVIDINTSCLIRDMLEQLDRFYAYTDMSKMVSWSASAGGLWNFLHTFLRNQDCLLETIEGACIIIDFETNYSGSIFHIMGHANWHTPNIRFLSLSASLSSGEEYCIAPSLPTIRDKRSVESACFLDDVRFRVLRSHFSDIQWDATKQCFRAVVPEHLKEVLNLTYIGSSSSLLTCFHSPRLPRPRFLLRLSRIFLTTCVLSDNLAGTSNSM
jgi:hypothetical protein